MIVYHDATMNSGHSKYTHCSLGNVINAPETDKQMCEFYCSHTDTFQHIVLRLMEGTTPVVITAIHLYPIIH